MKRCASTARNTCSSGKSRRLEAKVSRKKRVPAPSDPIHQSLQDPYPAAPTLLQRDGHVGAGPGFMYYDDMRNEHDGYDEAEAMHRPAERSESVIRRLYLMRGG
jgi:hypothetical protein